MLQSESLNITSKEYGTILEESQLQHANIV